MRGCVPLAGHSPGHLSAVATKLHNNMHKITTDDARRRHLSQVPEGTAVVLDEEEEKLPPHVNQPR